MASLREIFNNELCRRVDERLNTGKDNKIMFILQDINNKTDKLASIRASMSNVYIEAAQPKSKMTLKDFAW